MFFLLSFFLLVFYSSVFFQLSDAAVPVFIAGLVFLLIGLKVQTAKIKHEKYVLRQEAEILIAVTLSAAVTFLLSTKFAGPVIAASAVGLLYATLTRQHKFLNNMSGAVYCGAFVGMSSPAFGLGWIAFAGLFAGFILVASHRVYNKTGGTLGTIAFIAAYTVKILLGLLGG